MRVNFKEFEEARETLVQLHNDMISLSEHECKAMPMVVAQQCMDILRRLDAAVFDEEEGEAVEE